MEKTLRTQLVIAIGAVTGIAVHLVLRFLLQVSPAIMNAPLLTVLILGGGILVWELARKACAFEFGSDLLAGVSIVTSLFLGEYLAGTFVVLMLSGGQAIEEYALRSASSVLEALARRMPSISHRKEKGVIVDVDIHSLAPGDLVAIFPHEIAPVDGIVVEGRSAMDESFLTGEPFKMDKVPGCEVISGAINGEGAITVKATALAKDSRYQKIMQVMSASRQLRPKMRRLGDMLGAWYTPVA